jgi:hypothetical protein
MSKNEVLMLAEGAKGAFAPSASTNYNFIVDA